MFIIVPVYGSNRPVGRFGRGLAIANLLCAVALGLVMLALPVMVLFSYVLGSR